MTGVTYPATYARRSGHTEGYIVQSKTKSQYKLHIMQNICSGTSQEIHNMSTHASQIYMSQNKIKQKKLKIILNPS